MAQKRVNKGLVAFLTVMGIVLSVTVVGVMTLQASRKDPEIYAAAARDYEQKGDQERAIERYVRAFDQRKEVKYLVEASRLAYAMGDPVAAIRMLINAHNQESGNVDVLEALLRRFWEIRESGAYWPEMRSYSEKLLGLAPDHTFAAVCNARALRELVGEDPRNAERAREMLDKVVAAAPTDPDVTLARADALVDASNKLVRERDLTIDSPEVRATLDEAVKVCQAALAVHADHARLAMRLAELLAALGRLDEGIACLRGALQQHPDDAEIMANLGILLTGRFARQRDQLPESDARALADEGAALLRKAWERDAGLVTAAIELERHLVRDVDKKADPGADLTRRYGAGLALLEKAMERTIGLRSARLAMNPALLPSLYLETFKLALRYFYESRDADEKTAVVERARKILDQTERRFTHSFLPPYMRGELLIIDGKMSAAIAALEESNRVFARGPWVDAQARLAILYRQDNNPGKALEVADWLMKYYADQRVPAPVEQVINRAELLNLLDRPQDALNYVSDHLEKWPTEDRLIAAKAEALRRLGRSGEAAQTLAGRAGQSTTLAVQAARLALSSGHHQDAEDRLRQVLEANPANLPAARLLANVAFAAKRRDEVRQFVESLLPRIQDEGTRRVYSAICVTLAAATDEERDARLRELIDAIPEPDVRLAETFNLHLQRDELDQAAAALAELEKLRPEDADVLDKTFTLALRQKDFARAEKYATRLAVMDADGARGAMYRGRLEAARGDFKRARAEFLAADQTLPPDADRLVLMGQTLLQGDDADAQEAVEVLNRAVQLNPRSAAAHKLLYVALGRQGNLAKAADHLAEAARLNPRDEFIRERKELLDEEQDPRAGIPRREARRQSNPDDVENLARLGLLYAHAKVGDSVKAEECLSAALKADPKNLTAIRAAVQFFVRAGRREDVLRVLRAYIDSVEGHHKVGGAFLLAGAFEELGDQASALETYRDVDRTIEAALPDPEQRRLAKIEATQRLAEFCTRVDLAKDAVEALRRTITLLKPEERELAARARLRMIQVLIATRRLGDAEQEISALLRDAPNDVRALLERGRLLALRDEVEPAIAVYAQVLQQSPENAHALFMRGSLLLDLHRPREAIADLLAAKRLSPRGFNLAHFFRLSEAYESNGEWEKAESELVEALEIDPADATMAERLLVLYQRHRRLDVAEPLARRMVARQPNDPLWHHHLGRILVARREHSAAVEPLLRAADLARAVRPAKAPAIFSDLLQCLNRANRPAEAARIFENLDPRFLTPQVRVRGAEAFWRTDRRADAEAQLLNACQDASSTGGWAALAAVTHSMRDSLPKDALLSFFESLPSKAGDDAGLALQYRAARAQALVLAGRGAEARTVIDELLAGVPPGSSFRIGLLELKAQTISDPAEQVKVFETILAEQDSNIAALNNVAYLYADRLNRPKEAVKLAERARQMAGPEPNVLDTLGWARLAAGDAAGAEAALSEAVRLDPDNLMARYHLGRAYQALGQSGKAREVLEPARDQARRQNEAETLRLIEEALRQ